MAASLHSLNSFCVSTRPSLRLKHRNTFQAMQTKAQGFRDEGKPSNNNNMVDANLRVLRERIEEVKIKDKLERCQLYGWNYTPGCNYRLRREKDFLQLLQLTGLIGGTIGLTFITGTLCLCLVSLFLHFNQYYM